jgi:hypothetical protein
MDLPEKSTSPTLALSAMLVSWAISFYSCGGERAKSRMSTVGDRIAVPMLLAPLHLTGQLEAAPTLAIAHLALCEYLIWRRQGGA